MSYTFDRIMTGELDAVIEKVTAALKERGFGILTEIDVQATLKKKLDVDVPPYRILGACNPPLAHRALQAEPRIGAMLPCNVIVRETGAGEFMVSAIDPVASMQAIQNPQLGEVAEQVRRKLQAVIEGL
jgi:uncharacterized protein (DUF302 family)